MLADEDDQPSHGYSVTMVASLVHRKWVLLSYRLPREPSTPRIAHWRALRRLGVAQLHDGLAALPASDQSREQLEWLADAVSDAGGTAYVWLARMASAADERALVAHMRTAIGAEYGKVAREARIASREPDIEQRRTLSRLRREIRQIRSRDYFGARERTDAERAMQALTRRAEDVA